MAEVVAVCISEKKGTIKKEVPEIEVKLHHGIVGDAHAGDWHRQISLLAEESINKIYTLPIGTKLRVGQALLEVTQIGKECHNDCAIKKATGDCVMPREGIFTVVLEEGEIKPGDSVEVVG